MGRPSRRRLFPPPAHFVAAAVAAGHPPPREPLPRPLWVGEFMVVGDVGGEPCPAPSQASSSAAPPSDLPGAERTGSGTRVRQSVLYSDRPRRLQRRRPLQHVEDPSEVSSTELEVTSLPTFGALSASGSAEFHPSHPGAEGPVSGTRIWQSVLYSSRPRRPQRRQEPLLTEEHPSELTTDLADTDLAALEALALMNELPLLSPEEQEIVLNFHRDDEHHREAHSTHSDLSSIETVSERDTEASLESYFLYADELPERDAFGGTFVTDSPPSGVTRSMLLEPREMVIMVSDDEEQPKQDSDVESNDGSDESQSETEEAAPPCATMREWFERVAAKHAARAALATEWGTEPTSDVIDQAAAEAQREQETRSLQAPQEDSAAAIQSHESSTEDIVEKGKKWMREEVMLCFEKYIARRSHLVGLEYKLDELCHQCFNVESYNNVFHHYNFRVMMKMPGSADWTVELYFAEVKQIFGKKYYFCCDLEPDEDADCYACKNQGVEDLKHPATGGFENGAPDAQCSLWFDF